MHCMAHSAPNSFSTISNISISVNNSNSNPVFFKQVCHANSGEDKNERDQVHKSPLRLFLQFSSTSASNNVSL